MSIEKSRLRLLGWLENVRKLWSGIMMILTDGTEQDNWYSKSLILEFKLHKLSRSNASSSGALSANNHKANPRPSWLDCWLAWLAWLAWLG
jgi:hypothetical protein